MELFEDKDYAAVFHKDDRNKRTKKNSSKRRNYKETVKRMDKIQERKEQAT